MTTGQTRADRVARAFSVGPADLVQTSLRMRTTYRRFLDARTQAEQSRFSLDSVFDQLSPKTEATFQLTPNAGRVYRTHSGVSTYYESLSKWHFDSRCVCAHFVKGVLQMITMNHMSRKSFTFAASAHNIFGNHGLKCRHKKPFFDSLSLDVFKLLSISLGLHSFTGTERLADAIRGQLSIFHKPD